MKYYLQVLMLLFSCVPVLQAQANTKIDYLVRYDFYSPKDTNELSFYPPDEYLLIGRDGKSRFMEAAVYFNDSIKASFSRDNPSFKNPKSQEEVDKVVTRFMEFRSQWYKKKRSNYRVEKDMKEGLVKSQFSYGLTNGHLELPVLTNWEIQEDTDTLLGFSCHKATIRYGGRNYTAWFVPEIPVADGPYVFSGLPGLIVKVTDNRGWFTFQLADWNPKPKKQYWENDFVPATSRVVTRKSYVEQSRKTMENPAAVGNLTEVDDATVLRLQKRFAVYYFMLLEQL